MSISTAASAFVTGRSGTPNSCSTREKGGGPHSCARGSSARTAGFLNFAWDRPSFYDSSLALNSLLPS